MRALADQARSAAASAAEAARPQGRRRSLGSGLAGLGSAAGRLARAGGGGGGRHHPHHHHGAGDAPPPGTAEEEGGGGPPAHEGGGVPPPAAAFPAEEPRRDRALSYDYAAVTCVFADVVGWTGVAASMAAPATMELLGRLFYRFDTLAVAQGVYKVEARARAPFSQPPPARPPPKGVIRPPALTNPAPRSPRVLRRPSATRTLRWWACCRRGGTTRAWRCACQRTRKRRGGSLLSRGFFVANFAPVCVGRLPLAEKTRLNPPALPSTPPPPSLFPRAQAVRA